jgi:purine-binding chemotaxis protein CheW
MTEINLEQILTKNRSSNKDIVNVDEPQAQLVVFSLGRDWYAFYGEYVREILAHAEIFFLPCCPPSLEGVINVRGDIESVIHMNDLLGAKTSAGSSTILLGRASAMNSGIRVDRVIDVIEIPQSSIQPPPADLPESLQLYVKGIFHFQGHPVNLLDIELIFTKYAEGLG